MLIPNLSINKNENYLYELGIWFLFEARVMYIESILLSQYFSSKEFIVNADHMLTILYIMYLFSCGFSKLEF